MFGVMATVVLATNAALMPVPGVTYTGSVKAKDGRECAVVLWEGMAPYKPLLTEEEQKQLAGYVEVAHREWNRDESWVHRAALLRPYVHLLFDSSKELPFRSRSVTYQQFALRCGADAVRGALASFPPMGAGGVLVLKNLSGTEYLVVADFQPKATETMENLQAFVAKYRADLEKAQDPAELPREIRNEMANLEKTFAEKERFRLRFWDVNGVILPACPGSCPPGTVTYALKQLPPEAERAFRMALALLSGRGQEREDSPTVGRFLRVLEAWPEELGESPFLGVREAMQKAHSEALTFSMPDPALVQELWGKREPQVPEFDGNFRQAVRLMTKSF
ncbi:MAG: hypothetical protein ACP5NF_07125 [Thermoanaerobaculum sp.]